MIRLRAEYQIHLYMYIRIHQLFSGLTSWCCCNVFHLWQSPYCAEWYARVLCACERARSLIQRHPHTYTHICLIWNNNPETVKESKTSIADDGVFVLLLNNNLLLLFFFFLLPHLSSSSSFCSSIRTLCSLQQLGYLYFVNFFLLLLLCVCVRVVVLLLAFFSVLIF